MRCIHLQDCRAFRLVRKLPVRVSGRPGPELSCSEACHAAPHLLNLRVMLNRVPRPRRRSTGGFSLVEAMVVVVILGVLTLIFAPRLEPIMAGRGVNGARAGFTNLYNLARTYAVQLRGVATVEVTGGRAVATINTGGAIRSIGSAVAFDSTFRVTATANPTSVVIQPTGLVTTGLPFELVLVRSGVVDTLRISGYGRVE